MGCKPTLYLIFLLSAVLVSCLPKAPLKPVTPPQEKTDPLENCAISGEDHIIFSILIDGKDVGREVRSISSVMGVNGAERHYSSHKVTRMKIGSARYEKREVRNQRTDQTGKFIGGSYVNLDQLSSRNIQITYDGSTYMRHTESSSEVSVSTSFNSADLELEGDEIVGFSLIEYLRDIASKPDSVATEISFYEPLLAKPVSLLIPAPVKGTILTDGQDIEGFWCEAIRADTNKPAIRAFFDKKGSLWVEEYPQLHHVHRRLPGPLSLSMDTSELLVGLHSEAYISDPNAATNAVFRIKSSQDRLDSALELLSVPLNHKIKRISPEEILLEVEAGSPDDDVSPIDLDLKNSPYVQPDSEEIMGAYRYLRSSGKRGKLTVQRQYNATSVIARASLIRNPKRFWSNPDKVAGLTMHYVSALLPDKTHTFSMADSITTLERGSGDCTEHAVLFAALMRAARIPTRLIAGMKLNPGGMWGYHMWNEYWNGDKWISIDSSTMSYRPGAVYIALGRGVSRFHEVRDRLDVFMKRVFFGVSIDLIEASNDGELLFLARPRNPNQNLKETALLNAVVLSQRGDHKGAIEILDDNIPGTLRPLTIKMMHIELLVLDGRHEEALENIRTLRSETSAAENVILLDKFELRCLLTMGKYQPAQSIFERIDQDLSKHGEEERRILLKAEFLFGLGKPIEAVSLLSEALLSHPDSTSILTAFAQYVSSSNSLFDSATLNKAQEAAKLSSTYTLMTDHKSLIALARIQLLLGNPVQALRLVDHALILAPADRDLHDLRKLTMSSHCAEK